MIDKIDRQILRLLQFDAKMTTKEIAAELGLTTTPIHERIKKLEREGYIKQYSIVIDRKKVGLGMMAFCSVSLKNPDLEILENRLTL
uniref:Lrp/AsnC family transcriptional regulator n=1 Tax=Roseivirga sp. TaxID=1964215 RepID=UPI004047C79E